MAFGRLFIQRVTPVRDCQADSIPMVLICGQVPREEMGSDFFQEVDNDAIFADVAVFGIPDDEWGESVKAVVEPMPEVTPPEARTRGSSRSAPRPGTAS